MAMKQDFAHRVKAQMDVWQGQIKDYQEQLEQAGEKAKAESKKAVAQMQKKRPTKHASFSKTRRAQARVPGKMCTVPTRRPLPNCRKAGPTRCPALDGERNSSPTSVHYMASKSPLLGVRWWCHSSPKGSGPHDFSFRTLEASGRWGGLFRHRTVAGSNSVTQKGRPEFPRSGL